MLYIVRHCSTLDSEHKILLSDSDLDLSEVGILEAKKLDQWFKDKPIEVILTSSLKRANQTAKILNSNLRKPIYIFDELKERNVDSMYSNKRFEELDLIRKSQNQNYSDATQDWEGVENVESDELVFQRLKRVLEPFFMSHENIVLVSHAGVIKSFLHSVFKIDKSRTNGFKIKRGSVLVFENMKDFNEIRLIGMYQL